MINLQYHNTSPQLNTDREAQFGLVHSLYKTAWFKCIGRLIIAMTDVKGAEKVQRQVSTPGLAQVQQYRHSTENKENKRLGCVDTRLAKVSNTGSLADTH